MDLMGGSIGDGRFWGPATISDHYPFSETSLLILADISDKRVIACNATGNLAANDCRS